MLSAHTNGPSQLIGHTPAVIFDFKLMFISGNSGDGHCKSKNFTRRSQNPLTANHLAVYPSEWMLTSTITKIIHFY